MLRTGLTSSTADEFTEESQGNSHIATTVEEEKCSIDVPQTGPYRIVKIEILNITVSRDILDSWILGSCSLQNEKILLADNLNTCVSRLSLATSTSDNLKLPDKPWAVCYINEQEATVTFPDTRQVQIISIGQTMKTTRSFNVDFECFGIAYHDEALLIAGKATIYVYNLTSQRLRHFSMGNNGRRLFSEINNLTVSSTGHLLFIAKMV